MYKIMKKLIFIFLTIVLTALTSCTKKVDPIHGTEPLTEAYSNRISMERFNSLRQKDDVNGMFEFIEKYRKQLTANIVTQHPEITDHNLINLILGSGYAEAIEAGDGKTYSGEFNNEILIITKDSVRADTTFLFGGKKPKSELKFKKKVNFGHGEPFRFVIKEKENIDSLIVSLKDWNYITNIKIPREDGKGNIIEQQTFPKYLMDFKPFAKEGDIIDIINGKIFDKDGQEISIEKRKSTPKNSAKRKRR